MRRYLHKSLWYILYLFQLPVALIMMLLITMSIPFEYLWEAIGNLRFKIKEHYCNKEGWDW